MVKVCQTSTWVGDYVDRSLVDESKSSADSWLNTSTSEAETSHMKAQQWMLFLDHLINAVVAGQSISHSTLENMDSKYKISATSNVEVSFRQGTCQKTFKIPMYLQRFRVLTQSLDSLLHQISFQLHSAEDT